MNETMITPQIIIKYQSENYILYLYLSDYIKEKVKNV